MGISGGASSSRDPQGAGAWKLPRLDIIRIGRVRVEKRVCSAMHRREGGGKSDRSWPSGARIHASIAKRLYCGKMTGEFERLPKRAKHLPVFSDACFCCVATFGPIVRLPRRTARTRKSDPYEVVIPIQDPEDFASSFGPEVIRLRNTEHLAFRRRGASDK